MLKKGDIKTLSQLHNQLSKREKITLTNGIYSIIMNGCAHAGDITEAKKIYKEIIQQKRKPTINTMTSFIDCLSRKNELKEAHKYYKSFSSENNIHYTCKIAMLQCILSSCVVYNNTAFGKEIYNEILGIYRDNGMNITNGNTEAHLLYSKLCAKSAL